MTIGKNLINQKNAVNKSQTVLTSAKSKFNIVCPYSETMVLHSVLITPDAPIAWFIIVIIVYNNNTKYVFIETS